MEKNAKTLSLIRQLMRATEEEKIRWTKTALPHRYQAVFADYGILIGTDISDVMKDYEPVLRASAGVRMDLVDTNGSVIDSLIESPLGALSAGPFAPSGPTLAELLRAIQAKASGTDRAIDSILKALKD